MINWFFSLIKRYRTIPPTHFVEIFRDEWQTVAMGFSDIDTAVNYAKKHYSVAWNANLIRIRKI